MAPNTLRPIPCDRSRAAGDVVRIMTRAASQPSVAYPETGRLPEPIRLVDNFEPIPTTSNVEMRHVGAERLSQAEGKDSPVEAAEHLWQLDTVGLEMALHADVHLK